MRTLILCLLTTAAFAQNDDAARRAAEAAAQQQRQHQAATQQRMVQSLIALDPTHLQTVALWPQGNLPCKLPKRGKPYSCRRVLTGPLLILSPLPFEAIVARGDAALARGDRSWWRNCSHFGACPTPMALAPGEVLYQVGDDSQEDDWVVTIYRP